MKNQIHLGTGAKKPQINHGNFILRQNTYIKTKLFVAEIEFLWGGHQQNSGK